MSDIAQLESELTQAIASAADEAALEAVPNIRALLLPRTPLREWQQLRQVMAAGQVFKKKIGQRRGRFADGEARMSLPFKQDD